MKNLDAITETAFKKLTTQINMHTLRDFSKMARQNMSDNLDNLDSKLP